MHKERCLPFAPTLGDSLDALSGSCWFSTLDLAQGFYQVEMDENDKQKTAFATHRGLFQFKVMPFGLCNSPATFERLMKLILSGVLFERCLSTLTTSFVSERRRRRRCITSGLYCRSLEMQISS